MQLAGQIPTHVPQLVHNPLSMMFFLRYEKSSLVAMIFSPMPVFLSFSVGSFDAPFEVPGSKLVFWEYSIDPVQCPNNKRFINEDALPLGKSKISASGHDLQRAVIIRRWPMKLFPLDDPQHIGMFF